MFPLHEPRESETCFVGRVACGVYHACDGGVIPHVIPITTRYTKIIFVIDDMESEISMLDALSQWEPTRSTLHAISGVLAALRKAYTEPQPLALHLSLYISPTGLSTGGTSAGRFVLNFANATIEYYKPNHTVVWLPLTRYATSADLMGALLGEITADMPDMSVPVIHAPEIAPLYIREEQISAYGQTLQMIYTAISRVRGRLLGAMTPIVVWGHGFDVSTLWFKGGELDENQPHINIGFSPGSAGLSRPYIYVYAYPMPEDFETLPLPSLARWYTESWNGAVIDYDSLRTQESPLAMLETQLTEIFDLLETRL
jgi:hypothetical protein